MTSEQRYDISPQPPDTCPLINEIQSRANALKRRLHNYDRLTSVEDIETLHDICSDVERFLDGEITSRVSTIERVRDRVIEIRSWGTEWKVTCKEHIQPFHEDYQI